LLMTEAAVKPSITQDKAQNGMLTIAPGGAHTATFIGPIHGLGDTNMGWADAAYQLHLSSQQHVKFILPNAPVQPVTLNMGMAMPSWYDITSLDDRANQECEGIESAREMVTALIEREVASGIPLSRIVVGGFSQGGALALYTGMQYDGQLAGVCCMSGCKAARPRTLRSRLAVSTNARPTLESRRPQTCPRTMPSPSPRLPAPLPSRTSTARTTRPCGSSGRAKASRSCSTSAPRLTP
jgi:predicted esterase